MGLLICHQRRELISSALLNSRVLATDGAFVFGLVAIIYQMMEMLLSSYITSRMRALKFDVPSSLKDLQDLHPKQQHTIRRRPTSINPEGMMGTVGALTTLPSGQCSLVLLNKEHWSSRLK